MPQFKLSQADSQKIMAAIKRTAEPAAALMTAVAAYNEALGPLRQLIRTIEIDWQAAWDARAERWQEGPYPFVGCTWPYPTALGRQGG
jgi:hypothetical protein